MRRKLTALAFVLGAFGLLAALGPDSASPVRHTRKPPPSTNSSPQNLIAVAPPPFSKDIFPCSECHRPEDAIDTKPHPVPDHETVMFEHDKENRWCLDCHATQQRDKLHLADGRLIPFEESFRLCGQCHGPELRDWKAGIHGKRTGFWNGRKEYLLCAHCHNPHSPAIKAIPPLPPPIRQENIR
jgi:hypothetical protein